jgi:hypothetical protein
MSSRIAFVSLFVIAVWGISSAQESDSKEPSPHRLAQCEFSDGRSITVSYPSVLLRTDKAFGGVSTNEATTFVTNEDLVTLKGTNVPSGEYTFSIAPRSDAWELTLIKLSSDSTVASKSRPQELGRVPLFVMKFPRPAEKFGISFDHIGGSCMMKMRWWNTQASLEFTERNTDLPVTK